MAGADPAATATPRHMTGSPELKCPLSAGEGNEGPEGEGTVAQDKVAVVTGAGSGIGRGIAQALAARGARVAAVDIDGASAAETARLLMSAGGKALGVQADTSLAADVDRAVSTAVSQLGALDIMVNNAGILDGYFNVDETDDAVWAG